MLLRETIGEALRRHRTDQDLTLREVSAAAAVSLGYLSEVERGKKEPSSELLASICRALRVPLADLLREVSEEFAIAELVESETILAQPVAAPAVVALAPSAQHFGDTPVCLAA